MPKNQTQNMFTELRELELEQNWNLRENVNDSKLNQTVLFTLEIYSVNLPDHVFYKIFKIFFIFIFFA